MKRYTLILVFTVLLFSCKHYPPEQQAIMAYMKDAAHNPSSYEPISFEFVEPYTYKLDGLGDDETQRGDVIRHTFRATNGFGALVRQELLFVWRPDLQRVEPASDKLIKAINPLQADEVLDLETGE